MCCGDEDLVKACISVVMGDSFSVRQLEIHVRTTVGNSSSSSGELISNCLTAMERFKCLNVSLGCFCFSPRKHCLRTQINRIIKHIAGFPNFYWFVNENKMYLHLIAHDIYSCS